MDDRTIITFKRVDVGGRPCSVIEWNGPLTTSRIQAFADGCKTKIVIAAANYMAAGVYRPGAKGRIEFKPGTIYYVCFPVEHDEEELVDAVLAIGRARSA